VIGYWTDFMAGAAVQLKEGDPCGSAGIVYRLRPVAGQPPTKQYYQFVLQAGGTASLMRFNGTTFDRILTANYPFQRNAWYTVRVKVVGAQHQAYINGQPVLSWVDATYDRGTAGVTAVGTRAWFDNVTVLVAGAPAPLAMNGSDQPSGQVHH
jgi:hypothetical protein